MKLNKRFSAVSKLTGDFDPTGFRCTHVVFIWVLPSSNITVHTQYILSSTFMNILLFLFLRVSDSRRRRHYVPGSV